MSVGLFILLFFIVGFFIFGAGIRFADSNQTLKQIFAESLDD